MRVLAAGLDLPMNASRDDLAQMISGKLTDDRRQPKTMQLVVGERKLELGDEDGVFLELDSGDPKEEHRKRERRCRSHRRTTLEKNLSA